MARGGRSHSPPPRGSRVSALRRFRAGNPRTSDTRQFQAYAPMKECRGLRRNCCCCGEPVYQRASSPR